MQKQIALSIQSPCTEKWENFKGTSTGGFCQSCQKNVVDFTQMTDMEIINYLKTTNQNTCGRFQSGQLKTYPVFETESGSKKLKWLKAAVASIVLLWSNTDVRGQEQMVPKASIEYNESTKTDSVEQTSPNFKGIVRDEYGIGMAGVTIILEGTSIGTVTNLEGEFEFPKELNEGDVLMSSFIGYEPVKYVIKEDGNQNLEFQFAEITFDSCDMLIMGDISIDHVYEPKKSTLKRIWDKTSSAF